MNETLIENIKLKMQNLMLQSQLMQAEYQKLEQQLDELMTFKEEDKPTSEE